MSIGIKGGFVVGFDGTEHRLIHDIPPRKPMALVMGGIGEVLNTPHSNLDLDDPMSAGNIERRLHNQSRQLEPVITPMNGTCGERAVSDVWLNRSAGLGTHGVNKPIVVRSIKAVPAPRYLERQANDLSRW